MTKLFAVGDVVTVKQSVIEDGWPEFQGKVGAVTRVYNDSYGGKRIITCTVQFTGISYRPDGLFTFHQDELDPVVPSL